MNGLIRYRPLSNFLTGDIDDFFYPWTRSLKSSANRNGDSKWHPSVDVVESDAEFTVNVELAGVSKDDVKVEFKDGSLTISGERKFAEEDKKTHRVERFYGSFVRSFSLPENVNADSISAESRDGVLSIHLPKVIEPASEAKLIDIKSS